MIRSVRMHDGAALVQGHVGIGRIHTNAERFCTRWVSNTCCANQSNDVAIHVLEQVDVFTSYGVNQTTVAADGGA